MYEYVLNKSTLEEIKVKILKITPRVKCPVILQENLKVVASNNLMKAKLDLTLMEDKLFSLIVSQVRLDDCQMKTYHGKLKDIASFLGIDASNLWKKLPEIQHNLAKQTFKVQTYNFKKQKMEFKEFPLFSCITVSDAYFEASLNNNLKIHIMGLEGNYTQYGISLVRKAKSPYTLRLIRYLKSSFNNSSKKVTLTTTIAEFAERLILPESYLKVSELRRRVLNVCALEINEDCELAVSYELFSSKKNKVKDSIEFRVVKLM